MTASVPPSKSVPQRVQWLRAGGVVCAVLVSVAAALLAPQYPVIVPAAQLVVWWIGKSLGMPIQPIVQLALATLAATKPERAVQIATDALRSLPPESAHTLVPSSVPPAAAEVVLLMNTDPTAPPPPPPPRGH
jgi:hypothetical protein